MYFVANLSKILAYQFL